MADQNPRGEKAGLYLEDLQVGQRFQSGTRSVDEEQIRIEESLPEASATRRRALYAALPLPFPQTHDAILAGSEVMTAVWKSNDIKESGTRGNGLMQDRARGDVPHYYDGIGFISDGQYPLPVPSEGGALHTPCVPLKHLDEPALGYVPYANRIIKTARQQRSTVRRKTNTTDPLGVTGQRANLSPRLQVPKPNCCGLVITGGVPDSHKLAIRRDGQAVGILRDIVEGAYLPAAVQVPDAQGAVHPSGDSAFAVRQECRCGDLTGVPL